MIRCAIYTRKSTDEGLEQDFNSLDAQRESCRAYIQSHRPEGWRAITERFDDGGYSGGSLDRPALSRLLLAIEDGKIDVVVVYKVDRLTRALNDFARIVALFDAHDVSFVSVTQQFNTTTSMGRLTLNVLLSFAQFEREVTAERIRDKIAASKKKGLWMGGPVPLGYDVQDRRLVINAREAATVRTLFDLYLELGTVRRLKTEADRRGLVTKRRQDRTGRTTGGKPFSRGNLYGLLANPVYVGRITHKGQSYPGQHDAIIDDETWRAVQAQLAGNTVQRTQAGNAPSCSLLTGLVFDEAGDPLCPVHTTKNQKRYRYYVSKRLMHDAHEHSDGWRLPAPTLEDTVITAVRDLLGDPRRLLETLHLPQPAPAQWSQLTGKADALAADLICERPQTPRDTLCAIVTRIALSPCELEIALHRSGIAAQLGLKPDATREPDYEAASVLQVPVTLRRRGIETKLVIAASGTHQGQLDTDLIGLIASAHKWFDELAIGAVSSVRALARREGLHESEITRALPLAFLAPDIVEAILDGRQPVELTVTRLKRMREFPSAWPEQRQRLGFTSA